jgi:SAM-dependent methyltransferase
MTSREISGHVRRMRSDWERRARENARHYVVTGRERWSDEEFYRSGQVAMEEDILNDLDNICQGIEPRRMKVLEIGCGAGRVTRAFGGFFGEVFAVDISREMVRQARRVVSGFPNVHVFRNNGQDLAAVRQRWWHRFGLGPRLQLDFAFSSMVFQHIPSREIVESYVRETNRVLRPGALFKFQVQGSLDARPKPGDSWVGVPFSETDARGMADRCGFEMRYHHGAGDQYYWLWFFKTRDLA